MGWGVHDYPEPPADKPEDYPHCSICGEECDTIFRDRNREVLGCENCIDKIDAWDCEECFPEKE